jgi:hypothetical protein
MGKSLGTMIVYYKIPRGRGQAMGGNVTDCDCPWERILKSCPAVWIFDIVKNLHKIAYQILFG